MKQLTIFLFIIGIPIIGFSQQTINGSITHDNLQRDYILYVPANYTGDSPVPVVFNFHGYTSNANEQMFYGDFRAIADTAGFIIVHPQGTLFDGNTHWNVGGWTLGSTTDDVGFTEAMIDFMAGEYNIDLTRVYSTGMSNGGFMSFLLACQLSDKIAAIASVTGSMTPEIYNDCNPQHPMPVLQMHGTSDSVVPYTGETWTRSIDDVIQYWLDYNNCNTLPATTALPNTNTTDGSTVEHIVYDGGDNGATTEHFKITGGDHTWPGTVFTGPGTNQDINASLEIWKFFSRYDINGLIDTATGIEELGNNKLTIYPNPTDSHINIEHNFSKQVEYEIISTLGERLLMGHIDSNNQGIDLSGLSPNIYILKVGDSSFKILKMD